MVQQLFNKNIFMYIMIGLCVGGILIKVVLDILYSRLVKASDNMGTARNGLTQMMKKKFETCYKLKIGVNNVDIFVDKYVYRYKFCGVLLSTWENIGGQILMLCLLVGSISAVLGLIYECGKQEILSTFSVGILTSGLLIFLEGLMNFTGKRELIRLNMKDYLENFFKVRLEQELLHPELIEQYKREFLMDDEKEQVRMNSSLIAVADTGKLELNGKVKKKKSSVSGSEKRYLKKQQKEALLLKKEHKKIEIKTNKEREKEEKKFAAHKRRQELEQKKLMAHEAQERIKKEAKLALEKKREEERALIEQKKAEVRNLEEQKRKEKYRQEAIKKAMLLEKQVTKEENQKQSVEYKTKAQERKESLKKEVQQRRAYEASSESKAPENQSNIASSADDNAPAFQEYGNSTANLKKEISAENSDIKLNKEISADKSDLHTQANINTGSKLQVKPIRNKKAKQSDASDEKLIEDILKEFLA